MSDVTRILSQIEQGNPRAAAELLPLVYDELRKLAAVKLAQENPGQTLQATALVHEAYLRLVGGEGAKNQEPVASEEGAGVASRESGMAGSQWDSRGHFFGAAAEAMRRILVETARRKKSLRRGGEGERVNVDEGLLATTERSFDLLELDDSLSELERHDATAAQLVKLRYFAGFGHQEAAQALGIGRREADRLWVLARTWLYQRLSDTNA